MIKLSEENINLDPITKKFLYNPIIVYVESSFQREKNL